jgi:hypothetical protein
VLERSAKHGPMVALRGHVPPHRGRTDGNRK